MGGADSFSGSRSCCARPSELPPEDVRTPARTQVMCDGSKRTRLNGCVISERLLHQPIELAGSGVTLDLPIPISPILFHQPLPKLYKLLGVELHDLLFQLFDAGHGKGKVYSNLLSDPSK